MSPLGPLRRGNLKLKALGCCVCVCLPICLTAAGVGVAVKKALTRWAQSPTSDHPRLSPAGVAKKLSCSLRSPIETQAWPEGCLGARAQARAHPCACAPSEAAARMRPSPALGTPANPSSPRLSSDGSSCLGAVERNPIRSHEVAGWIPGLA